MNIYQGLLFLHGFRVLPEDMTDGDSAAEGCYGEADRTAPSAAVPLQGTADVSPVAGAIA